MCPGDDGLLEGKSVGVFEQNLARSEEALKKWEQFAGEPIAGISQDDWELASKIGLYYADTGQFLAPDRQWSASELARVMRMPLFGRFTYVAGVRLHERRRQEIENLRKD